MGNITEREVMWTLDALEGVLEENNYYGKNTEI